MIRDMRFCRGISLALVALWVVSCATVPPTAPPRSSLVESEAATYRSPADATRILEALDQKMAAGELTPQDLSTTDLNLYSNLLLTGGRWPEAEQALNVLETRVPDDRAVQWSLVLLTGARGDAASQQARLSRFEAQFPGDLDAASLRARLLADKGDRAGAKTAWTKVLEAREDFEALAGLAGLALDANRPQEARPWADRAVKAFADDDRAWALHAQVLTALKEYREAGRDLDRAVALAPDDPWHRLDRGKLAFLYLYDNKTAQADLEYTTLRLPGNFLGWEALAEVYEEVDRPRQAYDAWMKALSLRPDYAFAYPSAAMLSFRYQDWAHAAQYAREAAKAYPAEYAFPFVEALSLRALGQLPAATVVLQKARPRFTRGSTVDEMFRFLLTPGSDFNFNASMNLEKQETIRLRLRFYQGCYYALTKSPGAAKAAFQEVADSTLRKIPEVPAARDWLEHGL